MASSISWRKLAEYNQNGDMYLLVLLDHMWLEKKMKLHNGPVVAVKASPGFNGRKRRGGPAAKNILDDMEKVLNDEMLFDDPQDKDKKAFKQKYSGRQAPLRVTHDNGKQEDIGITKLEKTNVFGGSGDGGSGAGADKTELFESAACWVSALRFEQTGDIDPDDFACTTANFKSLRNVRTTAKLEDVVTFLSRNKDWLTTSISTANGLYSKFGGSKNYNFYRGVSIVGTIEEAFKPVNKNHLNADGKKVRPFANLNKWSPADIWMVEKSKESTFKQEIPKKTTFITFNEFFREKIVSEELIGISLKGLNPKKDTNISPWNFSTHVKVDRTLRSGTNAAGVKSTSPCKNCITKEQGADKLFGSIDCYLWGSNNMEIQFRATDTAGKTWQGEVLEGVEAKHGKIGGGVFDRFMKEIFTESFFKHIGFTSVSDVATKSKNADGIELAREIHKMVKKGGTMEHCSDLDDVPIDDILAMKPKWIFSKFLGLKMGEKIIQERDKGSKEFMTLIFRYATSQSELSGPFYKVTSK